MRLLELVEREAESALLSAAFERLVAGSGQVVLVAGEAGIGKTSLIQAALARAPDGVRVLTGGCDDLVAPNPLGAIREAFADTDAGLGDLAAAGAIHDVLERLVANVHDGGATALVIEDLHWADDATIDVVAYLARRLDHLPLLLIVSFRDDEVDAGHPAQRFLAVAPAGATTYVRPTPFSVAGVAALCTGTPYDPAELHGITSGNPFFVTESLAAPADQALPASVAAAVTARLRRLSPPGHAALESVSVWTGLLDFDFAEALLGPDLAQLSEAEQLGILVGESGGLRFRHELARRGHGVGPDQSAASAGRP